MATFNGQPIMAFNITGSGDSDAAQDVKDDLISLTPTVTNQKATVSAVADLGTRRDHLREDATITCVFRKTNDANGPWGILHDDKGDITLDCNYASAFDMGSWNGTFQVLSITAPYGPDGNQAFTVEFGQSGGAPITWS